MAVVDSLEISIQSKVDSANRTLDDLVHRLGLVVKGISAIGKNNGLDDFAQKALEATKGLSNIQNMAKGISSSITPEIQKVSKSFEQIAAQYANLGKNFSFKGSTNEIQKQIDKYTNGLEVAKLKKEELETAGKTEGKAYEAAVAKVIEYGNVIENLKQQLAEMQAARPQLQFNISGIEETREAIEAVGESIRETVAIPASAFNYNADAIKAVFGEVAENVENWAQAVEQFGEKAGQIINESAQFNFNISGIEETRQQLESFSGELLNTRNLIIQTFADLKSGNLWQGMFNGLSSVIRGIVSVGDKVINTVSAITSRIIKFAFGIKNLIFKFSNMAKSLIGIKGASKGFNNSFGSGFITMLKYGLGIRSLYALINKLRTAMKEGFKNLVQYSTEANTSISLLKNSLTQFKNATAAMFSPLLNAFAPAMDQIIQLCIKATNAINQLISSLLGKGTWIKAKTLTDNYAKSIDKAGKAAKGSLRPFDELKIITTQESGGESVTSPSDMFETVEIEDNFKNLAERLKGMWEKADFSELGEFLGIKLKNALDNISWEDIKEKGGKIASSLASLINGFIGTPGLAESIGKTVGETINTGVSTAKTFLEQTDFFGMGKFFAETINGVLETTEWGELAETISLGIEGALDTAIGFLDNFDWVQFAESIEEFLAGIDLGGILGRLGLVILEALKGGFTVGNKLGVDLTSSLADFFRSIGWDSVAGFFEGLSEKIEFYGKAGKLGFEKVIQWVKDLLGIHSPSTVFSEIGVNVVKGFINGLSGLKENAVKIFNSVKEAIKKPINGIIGFINDMISGVVGGINGMIKAVNGLHFDLPDWLPIVGGKELGFTIPEIVAPQIPYLADGAVLRGGNPFLAVVNDQKRGQTNVETPLKVIQEALREELKNFAKSYTYNVEVARAPSLGDVYGDYAKPIVEYSAQYDSGIGYGTNRSTEDMIREIRQQSKLLREQNRLLDDIYRKPTMEIGDVNNALVSYSMYAGGNTRGGSMSRLAVAEELYR